MLQSHRKRFRPKASSFGRKSRWCLFWTPLILIGTVEAVADTLQPSAASDARSIAESYRRRLQTTGGTSQSSSPQQSSIRSSGEHLELSKQLYEEGKTFEALTHANYALSLAPQNKEAREWSERMRKAFESETAAEAKAEKYVTLAVKAENEGKTRRARNYWKKASRLLPHDADIARSYEAFNRTGSSYTGLRAEQVSPEALNAVPQQLSDYLITRGDVLEVFVWQHKDISRNVIVRPDGRISIPLVGDVEAAGLTLMELDSAITEKLRTYIRFPDVSLAIKRFGGTKTIVLGEVARPGVYIPQGEGSVVELIAMAGGFTSKAYGSDVLVIRGGLDQPQVTKLNLAAIFDGGRIGENIVLQPNDIVYVPKQRVDSIMDFVAKLTPILANTLLGQNIAANFGVYETSGEAARRGQ